MTDSQTPAIQNVAAARLRQGFTASEWGVLDAALLAERRLTVERVWRRFSDRPYDDPTITPKELLHILEDELTEGAPLQREGR